MAIRVQKKEKNYEAIYVYRSRPAIGSVREARPRPERQHHQGEGLRERPRHPQPGVSRYLIEGEP